MSAACAPSRPAGLRPANSLQISHRNVPGPVGPSAHLNGRRSRRRRGRGRQLGRGRDRWGDLRRRGHGRGRRGGDGRCRDQRRERGRADGHGRKHHQRRGRWRRGGCAGHARGVTGQPCGRALDARERCSGRQHDVVPCALDVPSASRAETKTQLERPTPHYIPILANFSIAAQVDDAAGAASADAIRNSMAEASRARCGPITRTQRGADMQGRRTRARQPVARRIHVAAQHLQHRERRAGRHGTRQVAVARAEHPACARCGSAAAAARTRAMLAHGAHSSAALIAYDCCPEYPSYPKHPHVS